MSAPSQLQVYVDAMALAKACLPVVNSISGNYRLRDQFFGAVTSIGANIAEWAAFSSPGSRKEKLTRCIAESNEVDFWLEICKEQGIIGVAKWEELTECNEKVRRKLYALKKTII